MLRQSLLLLSACTENITVEETENEAMKKILLTNNRPTYKLPGNP